MTQTVIISQKRKGDRCTIYILLRAAGIVVVTVADFFETNIFQIRKGARCTIYAVLRTARRVVVKAPGFLKTKISQVRKGTRRTTYIVLRATGARHRWCTRFPPLTEIELLRRSQPHVQQSFPLFEARRQ